MEQIVADKAPRRRKAEEPEAAVPTDGHRVSS